MSSLAVFETIDEVLQMSTGCTKPFGGKTILGIGDFRQVAPVIPGAGPSEILAASIKSSSLWTKFSIFSLTVPMRFGRDPLLCNFVDVVGEGWNTPNVSVDMFKTTTSLEFAAEFLYPAGTLENPEKCLDQAFLSPRNVLVDDFNNLVLGMLTGELCTWFLDIFTISSTYHHLIQ
jgi:hypothetical protein